MADWSPNIGFAPLDGSDSGITPSAPEQRRRAAASPDDWTGGVSAPAEQTPPPSLLNSSWLDFGKTLWDEGTRGVGLGTRAAITGLGGLADLATAPGRMGQRALGLPVGTPPTQIVSNAVGLPAPQTPQEETTSALVSGGASAIPALLTGGATSIPQMVRSGFQGAGASLAGDIVAHSNDIPDWLKPTAATVAGLLGAKGSDLAWGLGTKAANYATGTMKPTYDAFVRLGIQPTLGATVGETGQSLEAAGTRMPFASAQVRPAQVNMVNGFGDSVNRTANMLDPTRTAVNAADTGSIIQRAGRQWLQNFDTQQGNVWQPLNTRLAGTSVDLGPTQRTLDNLVDSLNLPDVQAALTPGRAAAIRDALLQNAPGGVVQWGQAQGLRSLVGNAMGVPEIAAQLGDRNLRALYGSLSDAMRTTAAANGQGGLFDAANAYSTRGYAFRDGTLQRIITKNNPVLETVRPEQVPDALLGGGDTTLGELRQNMPDAADALGAYNLRNMALAKPSQAVGYDDTSTGTFLSNVNRLRQQKPGGYQALYGNDPDVAQSLDDLQTVAGKLRATEKHLNTSGTAEQLGWMQWLNKVAEQVGSGEFKQAGGTAVSMPLMGTTVGKALASPELARFAGAQAAPPNAIPPRVPGILGALPYAVGQ